MNDRVKKIILSYLVFILLGVAAGIGVSLIAGLPTEGGHGDAPSVDAPSGDQAQADER